MGETLQGSSDPQAAVPVAKHPVDLESMDSRWERICHRLSIDESLGSALPAHQERALCIFTQTLYAIWFGAERIEFWRTRSPSPKAIFHSSPEVSFAIHVQIECSPAKAALSKALDVAVLNCTELSEGRRRPAGPDGSFMVLNNRENVESGKLRVMGQLAVFPTGKTVPGANPKRPVAPRKQAENVTGGKMLAMWWLPGNVSDPIEANQAEFRAEPQVAIGCLGN